MEMSWVEFIYFIYELSLFNFVYRKAITGNWIWSDRQRSEVITSQFLGKSALHIV